MQQITIVDVNFDHMENCAYLIFRNKADEYFKLKIAKEIGKKIELLIYNAFPSNKNSIYNSYIMLLENFGLTINSVIISNNEDSQTARLIMSEENNTIEIEMDIDDALMVGLITNADLFVDDDTDVEEDIVYNWYDLFSKIL